MLLRRQVASWQILKSTQLTIYQTLRRARNEERFLNHGWYVVKNRSSTETKANVSLNAARERESRLFAGEPWRLSSSGIQDDRKGIHSLRTGLSNVFCAHIRAEFPAFNKQTRTILNQKRAALAALGPDRGTVADQRNYLESIVDAYQYPKALCLIEDFRSGRNTEEAALALERRLAIKKKTNLRDSLKHLGAVWSFKLPTAERDDWSHNAASAPFVEGATKNIYTWINHRYQETKSCTMPGIVPYELIERLFEEQTANWKTITESFVESVKEVFISAAVHCLRTACSNGLICTALESLIRTEIGVKMAVFRGSCYSLIAKERKGMQVIACEEQFVNDIRNARALRFINAIARLENDSFIGSTNPFPVPQKNQGGSSIFANAKSTPNAGFGQSASTTSSNSSGASSTTGGLFGSLSTQASTTTSNSSEGSSTSATGGLFGSRSTPASTTSSSNSGGSSTSGGLFGSLGTSASATSSNSSGGPSTTSGLFRPFGTPMTTASETTAPKTTSLFGNIAASKPEATTITFRTLAEFAKDNKAKLAEVLTDDRQLVYEIHDILKAYYSISVQNYTDMVCKNELNDTFIKDTMNLFSKEFIGRLSESEISSIAAESPADRKKRRELKEDIEKLEMAISESEKILKQAVDD